MANNLYNTMYNPDVLSCIANLSNDEVFTPPEVANAMLDLLPQELFSDPNTTFAKAECFYGKLRKGSSRASSRSIRICRSARTTFSSISFTASQLRS